MRRSPLLVFLLLGSAVACSRDNVTAGADAQITAADASSTSSSSGGATDGQVEEAPDAGDAEAPRGDDDGPFDPKTGEEIAAEFAQIVLARHPPGTTGVKRAVFLKPHGCAKGTFTVLADLPDRYRVGVFAAGASGQAHPAWIRVSSDTIPQTSDAQNSTIGFSLKVIGIPGKKILAGEEDAKTHDFLLQNHHVFFVDTATEFLDFTKAITGGTSAQWLADHPTTKTILADMKKPVENVLGTRYSSPTPYRFGERDYAKYGVRPCVDLAAEAATGLPNYLRQRMERDIGVRGACFDLTVQLRGEGSDRAQTMPLDKATVAWSERVAPPVKVARIEIPTQDILANDAVCENLSFNAWHALPEHRPVGSINKARGIVYKQHADNRRQRNGVTLAEPEE